MAFSVRHYLALLESRSLKLQHRVADIVRQIQFAPNCSKPALWRALRHYQQKDGNVDKSAPVDFLTEDQCAALTDQDGKFRVSLYKALFFVEIAEGIKSGALNLLHSEKYRSLDEYMIQKADWEANRASYLQRAQLEGFADCKATLKALDQALDARYQETNQNLISGKNPYLTMRANGRAHVSTFKLEEVDCLPLGTFFPELKYISMLEMLATVDQATNFLDEFEHWQIKYQKNRPAKKTLFAGIIGYGCDIGHRKLAQISKQIDDADLDNAVNWYFSLGHSQEFIQSEKEDQEIAEACRRLIKNAIVCWNYLYLSRELTTEKNEERKAELIEAIRNGSVSTWKHFNLHGEFDFSDERMVDSMGLAVPKNPDWKPD